MSTCLCQGPKDLGLYGTQRPSGIAVRAIFLPKFAADGTRNKIAKSDVETGLDSTYWDERLKNTDPSQRWYITEDLKNVTDPREDPTTEEFDSGEINIVRQGSRTITFHNVRVDSELAGRYEAWACQKEIMMYTVDRCGTVEGVLDAETGDLLPFTMYPPSLDTLVTKQNNTEVGKIRIMLQYSMLMKDSDVRYITQAQVGVDLLQDYNALFPLTATLNGAATTTGFTVDITATLGREVAPVAASGLSTTTTDWYLYNTTTGLEVTITSITEAPDGTYALVFPAQTTADVLKLSTVQGDKVINEFEVTIP